MLLHALVNIVRVLSHTHKQWHNPSNLKEIGNQCIAIAFSEGSGSSRMPLGVDL